MSLLKKALFLSLIVFNFALVGCDSDMEDAAEDAGDNIEQAVDDAGDSVDDAAEDAEDTVEDVVD